MKLNLPNIQDIKAFSYKHWFEVLVTICLFITTNFHEKLYSGNEVAILSTGYLLLSATLFIKARASSWRKHLYITLLLMSAIYIIRVEINTYQYEYNAILFFISTIGLFLIEKSNSKEEFSKNAIKTAQNILVTIITSIAILICYQLIAITLESLLSVSIDKYADDIAYAIICISAPLTFIALASKTSQKDNTKLFALIGKYILSPTLIVATIIILIYLSKIIFKMELPQESVSTIMMVYLFIALIAQIIHIAHPSNIWNYFYKYIHVISLLPIAMLWIAISYRIAQFGFTDMRIFVLVVATSFTALAIIQWFKSWSFIPPIFIGICCSIFLMYSPILPAKSIERISQLHIYNKLAKQLQIYTPQNTFNPENKAAEMPKESARIMNIYSSLYKDSTSYIPKQKLPLKPNLRTTTKTQEQPFKMHFNNETPFPITGYTALITNVMAQIQKDSLIVTSNKDTLLKVSVKTIEQQLLKLTPNQHVLQEMIDTFNTQQNAIFTTPEYSIIISNIVWSPDFNNNFTIDNLEALGVLMK